MKNPFRTILNHRYQKNFYKDLIRENNIRTVMDAGACVGGKSRLFLENHCRVIAVEPNPECSEALLTLKNKFPWLIIENIALGNRCGKAHLRKGNHREICTLSEKMVSAYTVKDKIFWDSGTEVNMVDLEYLFNKHGIPDFLKMDCEGMDHVILQACKSAVPVIEFEYLKPFHEETLETIRYISSLAQYRFNFAPYEHGYLLFKKWMYSGDFINNFQKSGENIIHGNIICVKEKSL